MNKLVRTNSALLLLILIPVLLNLSCNRSKDSGSFTFAFITDIHLHTGDNAVKGFFKAIDRINSLNPDFVIAGGDLVMDAPGQRYGKADSLFSLYLETASKLKMPLYNTLGNHDIYGTYSMSGVEKDHPLYGEKKFEARIGRSYYSFDHKGWKFMILNSPEDNRKDRYVGLIDSVQTGWIKEELLKTDPSTPIAISTHMPFITVFTQKYRGSTFANDSSLVVSNATEILDLFRDHNLKLVLQGHLHIMEDIYIDGIRFITGGSVSGSWWRGPGRGHEEGFLLITVNGEEIDREYVDYEWVVEQQP